MRIASLSIIRAEDTVKVDELVHALQRWFRVILLYPWGKIERRLRPMSPVQETLQKELRLEVYA
jgi:hypothetical protein